MSRADPRVVTASIGGKERGLFLDFPKLIALQRHLGIGAAPLLEKMIKADFGVTEVCAIIHYALLPGVNELSPAFDPPVRNTIALLDGEDWTASSALALRVMLAALHPNAPAPVAPPADESAKPETAA